MGAGSSLPSEDKQKITAAAPRAAGAQQSRAERAEVCAAGSIRFSLCRERRQELLHLLATCARSSGLDGSMPPRTKRHRASERRGRVERGFEARGVRAARFGLEELRERDARQGRETR